MFLPTTKTEAKKLSIKQFDVILITGDTYFDSPSVGIAVLGNLLNQKGYKVGIIAQPDIDSKEDITRLGEPRLFWGVSGGSFDSMIANYTALKKRIKNDDMTPGGINNKRPDRAVIKYCNLIRRYFKDTSPIIIGGIEASLRRTVHYDFWSNKLRKSILFNSKADYLVYGMGEKTVLEIADLLKKGQQINNARGLCYISNAVNKRYLQLPSFDELIKDKNLYVKMFKFLYENNHPVSGKGLCQKHDNRYLIQNPPQYYLNQDELDSIYEMNYQREVHPFYKKQGKVKALDTTRFSVNSHRGCFGECNFCAISIHQGKEVRSRSVDSIIRELKQIIKHNLFKGIISDVGGPTANMFAFECKKINTSGPCNNKRCLFPKVCSNLNIDHKAQIEMLQKSNKLHGIRKVFVTSGIRYDIVLADANNGKKYLKKIVEEHTSGQLKIAPEHTEEKILKLMGKPDNKHLSQFIKLFYDFTKKINKNQFLTYYLIASYPGCNKNDMNSMKKIFREKIQAKPRQIQIFTPSPSTFATLSYFLEKNPMNNKDIFVEKNPKEKEKQKNIMFN